MIYPSTTCSRLNSFDAPGTTKDVDLKNLFYKCKSCCLWMSRHYLGVTVAPAAHTMPCIWVKMFWATFCLKDCCVCIEMISVLNGILSGREWDLCSVSRASDSVLILTPEVWMHALPSSKYMLPQLHLQRTETTMSLTEGWWFAMKSVDGISRCMLYQDI